MAPPSGLYTLEGPLGRISAVPAANTRAIYQCDPFPDTRITVDSFTSPDVHCEGKIFYHLIGYIFLTPPPGVTSAPITRCAVLGTGEHFDSASPSCEGQQAEGLLGYAVEG